MQAGPAAHSVPADVLGEGAGNSQGREWACRCVPSEILPGTCQQRPVGEGLPLPCQRLSRVWSLRQDRCIPGTPRLGLATRSVVGRRQKEGQSAHHGQVLGIQNTQILLQPKKRGSRSRIFKFKT